LQFEYEALDTLTVTAGAKFEEDDFSGSELQPSVRFLWEPSEDHSLWGSVSRAVRTASRSNEDTRFLLAYVPFASGVPGEIQIRGGDADSEELVAYELGYRVKAAERVFIDVAGFYNDYDDLIEYTDGGFHFPTMPGELPYLALVNTNTGAAISYGGELLISARPVDWLNLQASYWYIQVDGEPLEGEPPAGSGAFSQSSSATTSQNQVVVRALFDLPRNFEFDLFYRYVDRIRAGAVPAYSEIDVRIGWHPSSNLELALIGNNLLDRSHVESRGDVLGIIPTEVEREIWGKVTVHF
jgi:iron complex outermembrane receptor protein